MTLKLTGLENEYHFELRSNTMVVVGRAVTSDCTIVDATVSRRHAELSVTDAGIHLKDLSSSNGTFVNGAKIDTQFVAPGDTVTFGKVAFRVDRLVAPKLAPAPPLVPPEPPPAAVAPKPAATIVRPMTAPGRQTGSIKAVMAGTADPAEKDRQKLAILLDVSKGLTRATDVDALLTKVAHFAFEILEADRCAILLLDDQGNLMTKISRDKRGAEAAQAVPQSIARMAIDEQAAVVSENAGEDARFTGQSVLIQRVRSAMCVPLIGSEHKVLGVLYVDNYMNTHQFVEADVDFAIAFAGIAAVAIENEQFSDRIRQQALVRSNFERFFTPHLAARIANSADAVKLGGDKRRVAVLFSDIRGFTALSETMNPDEMARLLTEYFSEMVECVFRHGGTLDKFIGDAVMAQWGAPLSESDDADRAMSAAMDMMEALDKLNAHWAQQRRPTLAIGIGLNIGDAFAGNIGSERRLEYTVIGDTVNTASRLCGVAGPGEVLVSEEFRQALQRPPRLQPIAPLELKGKSQPVPIFTVVR